MKRKDKVIIATRGSKLALWQANFVASLLRRVRPEIEVDLKIVKTSGDKILDVPLAKIGGKGLFVKEIEETLLRGEADIAVHSMKDVPAQLPPGLEISVIPRREAPWDCFVSDRFPSLERLPSGAKVGTSSLRRQALIRSFRKDLCIENLRGNLDTRVKKMRDGRFDAIVVACAGMTRLNIECRYMKQLSLPLFCPAVGQGALGIEVVSDNTWVKELISPLEDPFSRLQIEAEREFLFVLEGGCQVPLGAHAYVEGEEIIIEGFVGEISGEKIIRGKHRGPFTSARAVGRSLALSILERGGRRILDNVYRRNCER